MDKFNEAPKEKIKFNEAPEEKIKISKPIRPVKEIEDITFRAVEIKEFQEAVRTAKNKLEAIKVVRKLLQEHFPEISELPEPYCRREKSLGECEILKKGHWGGLWPTSNEFVIAKNIIDLLYE